MEIIYYRVIQIGPVARKPLSLETKFVLCFGHHCLFQVYITSGLKDF